MKSSKVCATFTAISLFALKIDFEISAILLADPKMITEFNEELLYVKLVFILIPFLIKFLSIKIIHNIHRSKFHQVVTDEN